MGAQSTDLRKLTPVRVFEIAELLFVAAGSIYVVHDDELQNSDFVGNTLHRVREYLQGLVRFVPEQLQRSYSHRA